VVVTSRIFLTLVNPEGEWEGSLPQRRVMFNTMTHPIGCSSRTPKFGEYSLYYCFVDPEYGHCRGDIPQSSRGEWSDCVLHKIKMTEIGGLS